MVTNLFVKPVMAVSIELGVRNVSGAQMVPFPD